MSGSTEAGADGGGFDDPVAMQAWLASQVTVAEGIQLDSRLFEHWGESELGAGAEQDFQLLVAASADMNAVAGDDGVYRYVSRACERLFGWNPRQLQGCHQDGFVHLDDLPLLRAAREAGSNQGVLRATYRFRCADGSYRWTESTSRQVQAGGFVFVVTTLRDIAERQRADFRLQRQATTDPLTGVANRAVLMDRLRHALSRLDRATGVLAVFFLDLDRFKVVNDSLGHRVGDGVLQTMAERLLHFLRGSDTLARLGGDEFVVVAEDVTDEQAAIALGNRIIEAGRRPFRTGDEELVCTVSVGIAVTADSQHSPEGLLQEADLALYRAKDSGRDRAHFFDDDLRTRAVGRLGTERMLRRALDEERLRVEYQPIIDLRTGQPVGAEALLRIFDPTSGELLQPQSFLEVAEETGLLRAMDDWVFNEAVRQDAAWCSRFGHTDFGGVAINVTARHMADAGFAQHVLDALDTHNVPHRQLQVEVTERVLMEASNSAMTGLRELRAAGVKVSLDDFGTGYSSLAYLRQFPIDFVKIDHAYVNGLGASEGEDAMVTAIVGLAHALGLGVVAEGVEKRSELAVLTSVGCDRAQGYLFARPGSSVAVDELIMAGSGSPSWCKPVMPPPP